ncbi:MAG: transglutaminase-like domain-containing protein [Chryseosolibacter sp.]
MYPFTPLGRLTIVIVFLIAAHSSHAQKAANTERAKSLKAMAANKDARIVSYHYKSAYNFEISSNKISVTNNDLLDLISLAGNIDYVRPVFYNDNIALSGTEVRYTNGKSLKFENVCGNYEVDNVFFSDAKLCSYKFNFLHEGTEISFKSSAKYEDPKYLTKVFFHDELPVENREVTFTIPNTIAVDLVEINFDGFTITKSVSESPNSKTYKYNIKNIKAMRAEPNSLGHLHYYPHILVLTKEFRTTSGSQKVIASVEDLYQWYNSLAQAVDNNNDAFQEEVKRLIATCKTPEDKIRAIYYWVQDNIKYIAFEDGIAGFKPEAAQDVFANRYGDCKGMANLTKQMLKVAGFDARLTWIGTNRIPYTYQIPTLAVDNHMICTVYSGEKQFILDPTEKYIALGKHAERIQGKEMLIENGSEFIINKVPVSGPGNNLISRSETISMEGDLLKGQGEVNFNGESKTQILYLSSLAKTEDKKRLFDNLAVNGFTNVDKIELKAIPAADRENALALKYTYTLGNKISRFDNDIYIDLDWNKSFGELNLGEERETDYYFNGKIKQKTSKKFRLPTGYRVTHLPKNMSKTHPAFTMSVSFKQTGSEVIYVNEITVTDGIIRKGDFNVWNESILELKDIYNDQIVITKGK